MIGISKLYCGTVEPSDALRYGRESKKLPSHLLQFSQDKKTCCRMERRTTLQLKMHSLLFSIKRYRIPK